MGKIVLVIGFAFTMLAAAFIYFSESMKSTETKLGGEDEKSAPIIVQDISLFRFDGSELESQLSAARGYVVEPNIAKLEGQIFAQRKKDKRLEKLFSNKATFYFSSKNLSSLLQNSELNKVNVSGNVVFSVGEEELKTDEADFLMQEQYFTSTKPVQVFGPDRYFTGADGFKYDLKKEILEVFGQIQGRVKPDNINLK